MVQDESVNATTEAIPPERRSTPAVYIWAFFGVVIFLPIAFTWSRWLFGGHATPSPAGDSDIPTWVLIGIRTMEVVRWPVSAHATPDGQMVAPDGPPDQTADHRSDDEDGDDTAAESDEAT